MDIISQVPVEIAQNILSFLSPEDLLVCSEVSLSWRSLVDFPLLWRRHCFDRAWVDTHFVDEKRTHYPKSFIGGDGVYGWPLNGWAQNYQIRKQIPISWEKRESMDYNLSPHDVQITTMSSDGKLLAIGHADGVVSVLDVYRVPKLITKLNCLLKGYKVLSLMIRGEVLVLVQSKLLQIYKEKDNNYDLVDAKSFEMGFSQIEVLQRYQSEKEGFVDWYTSVIGSDRLSEEQISAIVYFDVVGDLVYVGVRDYQMIYVWSLIDGKREDTIHIPNRNCKLRDLQYCDDCLYMIYASRNVRHITAYDLNRGKFIFEVTTPECKTQKIIVDQFLVGVAISGPGLTSPGVIKVWDKDNGKEMASRSTGNVSFKTVTVLYDLVAYCEGSLVHIWEPKEDNLLKTFTMERPVVFLHPCPYKYMLIYTYGTCWLCDWVLGTKLYRLYAKYVKSGDYRRYIYSDETMILMKGDLKLIDMITFC